MGKPSKLKQQVAENRYSHGNGVRKLYDRDKKPDGLDEDVWSLAYILSSWVKNTDAPHRVVTLCTRSCITG